MSDVPSDPFRPSFFELYASEQLRSLLGPALRYIVVVLAQRRAGILLRLANSFDEAYALALFLVERHYLKTWGASFAEHFYSLKRRRRPGVLSANSHQSRSAQQKHEQLRTREIGLSLFFLVGAPYLASKAHAAWERIGGGLPGDDVLFGDNEDEEQAEASHAASGSQGATASNSLSRRQRVQDKLKDMFRTGYPYAQLGYQVWLLFYQLAYLFDRTPHWRPWFKWMRIDIRRLGPDDQDQLSAPLLPAGGVSELFSLIRHPKKGIRRALRSSPHMFFESLKYLLPAAIFGFKFLEWWYSSESPARRNRAGGEGGLGGGGRSVESGGYGSNVPIFGPPKPLLPDDGGVLYEPPPGFVAPVVKAIPGPGVHDEEVRGSEKAFAHPQKLARAGHHSATLLYNACGICGRTPIANPALLRTGYAFCYACAISHLEGSDTCPITLRPARVPGEEPRDAVRRVLT